MGNRLGLKTKSDFMATYIRVLSAHDLPARTDWWAAAELIDKGYASGHVLYDSSAAQKGVIARLLNFAPTVDGRLLADDLSHRLYRRSWRYRLWQALLALGSFGSGWLLGVTTEVGQAWARGMLGL